MPEENENKPNESEKGKGGGSEQQAAGGQQKQPPWGSDENFNPEKAWELIQNLRAEKSGDSDALREELEALKTQQQQQTEALAKALGVKPEETSGADDLAQRLNALQEQFTTAQRRSQILELAAEHEIPKDYQHLLTATDAETLAAQAKSVGELVKARNEASNTPTFQQNPGQGQGGGQPTSLADQIAAAEAEGDAAKVQALKTQQLFAASGKK